MADRIEKDTMGHVEVPESAYWGAQTQRSRNNFKIGGSNMRMPVEIVYAFAILKKSAAQANHELGALSEQKAHLISKVCDEIPESDKDEMPATLLHYIPLRPA